jgi:hypothetical protein
MIAGSRNVLRAQSKDSTVIKTGTFGQSPFRGDRLQATRLGNGIEPVGRAQMDLQEIY